MKYLLILVCLFSKHFIQKYSALTKSEVGISYFFILKKKT